MKEDTIAGLPAEKFLNRRVRLKNQHAGHMIAATLVSFPGRGRAEVRPDSHRGTEVVELERIHPWWSQNPGLKEEYDNLGLDVLPDCDESTTDEDGGTDQDDLKTQVKLPKIVIDPGQDPAEWMPKLEELRAVMVEEEEVRQMLRPLTKKKELIIKGLARCGVHVDAPASGR